MPSIVPFPRSSFDGMQLLERKVISTAATNLDTSTMDGDTDFAYLIWGHLQNDAGTASTYTLRMNGSNANVTRQILTYDNTTLAASRASSAAFGGSLGAGARLDFFIFVPQAVQDKGSRSYFLNWINAPDSAGQNCGQGWYGDGSAATGLTTLGVGGSQADAIGVNSQLIVFRVKEAS